MDKVLDKILISFTFACYTIMCCRFVWMIVASAFNDVCLASEYSVVCGIFPEFMDVRVTFLAKNFLAFYAKVHPFLYFTSITKLFCHYYLII